MKIALKTVIDAIEQASDTYTMFYDTKANTSVYLLDPFVTGETDDELETLLKNEPSRFLQFPTKYEIHQYRIMEDFIESLPPGKIKNELAYAIRGKGAFRRFKQSIWFHRIEPLWYDFLANAYREIAVRWCRDNGIAYE